MSLVDTVRTMIAQYGRSVVFQKLDRSAADPARPWLGAGAQQVTTSLSASAVFVPASGESLSGMTVDEELLKRVERVLLVAYPITGEDLENYDQVVDRSKTYTIDWTKPLEPGDQKYLWAMGLKR